MGNTDSAFRIPKSEIETRGEVHRWIVKLDFLAANPNVQPYGADPTATLVSYFKGPADRWRVGLRTYRRIVYPDLWPGIDLVYHGAANQLKYEFVVQPGADPAQIRLAYRGASSVTLNTAGQMEVATGLGSFQDDTPVAWQEINGRHVPISVAFDLTQPASSSQLPASSFQFRLGPYDPARPLILDPAMLIYCGYSGGAQEDRATAIAVDSAGNAYIAGVTASDETSFPESIGPDLSYNGGDYDTFIAKVKADGTGLLYAGYIGGSDIDQAAGIAVDASGNAYVTGVTASNDFPVTGGWPQASYGGGSDVFVAKVRADGTALAYSGYVGGTLLDEGRGIAVDGAGNAYITGPTRSTDFPTVGSLDPSPNGGTDAFVVKVNAAGTAFVYSAYFGGSSDDEGHAIAVDTAGAAYLTGQTKSAEASFPVIGGPDSTYNGNGDAFVAKINAGGTALVYCGYLGGTSFDDGEGIAVNSSGNAYITGVTLSDQSSFPVSGGPDTTFNLNGDAYIAKVKADGSGLIYAGYVGGSGAEEARAIAVDQANNAHITGWTESTDFPVLSGPDLSYNGGSADAFVAAVNAAGTGLIYAGYIGGAGWDEAWGVAVDPSGNPYVTGAADAMSVFPVKKGPALTQAGNGDAFIAKIGDGQVQIAARRAGNSARLTWQHGDPYTRYEVWRYTTPYFALTPPASAIADGLPPVGLGQPITCTLASGIITCDNSGVLGDPARNYYYVVRGYSDLNYDDSNRVGAFTFALRPGQ